VLPHFIAELVMNLTGLSAFYRAGQHIDQGFSDYQRTDVPVTQDSDGKHSWMT
jgi:hypothetical protein